MTRLDVLKTYKLYINGAFPRTESGRTQAVHGADGELLAHVCHGSRKDLRDAIEAARKAQPGWSGRTAYNRGQILYRMAEMLEGKREELASAIKATTGERITTARREVDTSIDRLVAFAGWADKFAQVLGCNNPVAGPFYNFTVPVPSGVTGVVAPDTPSLLGLVSLVAPPLCAGNVVVAIAGDAHPIPAALFAEVCATSDVPKGAVNIITSRRSELLEHLAGHREVMAISAANVTPKQAKTLRLGAAENVKRVSVTKHTPESWQDTDACESPWSIEPFVDMKTIWHPSGT